MNIFYPRKAAGFICKKQMGQALKSDAKIDF